MIKNVNGKRYNTKASYMIGVKADSYTTTGGRESVVVTLYKRHGGGGYFLHCETEVYVPKQNAKNENENYMKFEDVRPLDNRSAQMWAYMNLSQTEYEEEFEDES